LKTVETLKFIWAIHMSFLMPSGLADDGLIRKADPVVSANVAPDEQPNQMRWPREKPMQDPITSKTPKR